MDTNEEVRLLRDHVEGLNVVCRYLLAIIPHLTDTNPQEIRQMLMREAEGRAKTAPFISDNALRTIRDIVEGRHIQLP